MVNSQTLTCQTKAICRIGKCFIVIWVNHPFNISGCQAFTPALCIVLKQTIFFLCLFLPALFVHQTKISFKRFWYHLTFSANWNPHHSAPPPPQFKNSHTLTHTHSHSLWCSIVQLVANGLFQPSVANSTQWIKLCRTKADAQSIILCVFTKNMN